MASRRAGVSRPVRRARSGHRPRTTIRAGRKMPTLQQIGDRFGISRERVRQIESGIRSELAAERASAEPRATGSRVREQLGPVFTAMDLTCLLGVEVDPRSPSVEIELVLFFAGPYEIVAAGSSIARSSKACDRRIGTHGSVSASLMRFVPRQEHLGVLESQN